MKLANPGEMKKIDQVAIENYKIPGSLLMETAAKFVAEKARERIEAENESRVVLIIAGKGNNGGDAFAATRHLHQWGYSVKVVSLVPREKVDGDPEIFLEILEKLDVPIIYVGNDNSLPVFERLVEEAGLIIDGIFGTGIHGEVTGLFAGVIRIINESGKKVVSIDIPSGINGRNGQVCGIAVKADETVTFSLLKPGILQYPGKSYAGKISLADIGIPPAAIQSVSPDGILMDTTIAKSLLPQRPEDGHKGTFGRVIVITGSTGMTGAGTLAATAAFKTGSGLVYLAVPDTLAPVYGVTIPEAITLPLRGEDGASFTGNIEYLTEIVHTMDAVVIGPGLSTKLSVSKLVEEMITTCEKPMVIDADALNGIADNPEILLKRKAPIVITPHPGEFARLTGVSVNRIQKNRIEQALAFSERYRVTVVLKGAGTIIAYPDGKYYLNNTGHSGMAVAGSGDVLSGIIGSLIGQGVHFNKAATLGVFIHGRCGEQLAMENWGEAGFTAGELCRWIPKVKAEMKMSVPKKTDGRWIPFE